MVTLSTVKPNFEQINSQLQAYVSNKASWLSLSKSSTGTLLLDVISMVGEYDQYSIMAALRETNLDTPHLPESIYTNCRFLGVRLERKVPAGCQVTLQNSDLGLTFLEIPAFSQFEIEGTKYFNRESILFNNPGVIQTVYLYQGEIKTATFTATGLDYQTYKLEETDPWSISNNDIKCWVGDVEFTRSLEPVFQFGMGDTKFYENSLPDGNVECKFGTSIYGIAPTSGETITFKYAVTAGLEGNNSISDLKVTCSDYSSVVGETLTNSYGGGNQPSVKYYQLLGPASGASNGRGINREDFKALVAKYPKVKDCQVYGQAEIAPNNKSWMNVVGLMLLTEDDFSQSDFNNLVTYLKANSIFGFQYKWYKPEPVYVAIKVTCYMKTGSNLTVAQQTITEALKSYTDPQLGSLGKSLYASDVEDIIFAAQPTQTDYIVKETPQIDYVINQNQYIVVTDLDVKVEYSDRDNQTWVNVLDPYHFAGD